ncbi:MAG: DNA polymerase II large subunit, partial [Candidatus Thermoplasmatota archaeon]|nr:DNA polymerase II large subunit [Candidatus Thermoplasmatota archaeon]
KKRALEPYSELISTMKGENSDEDIENSKKLLKKCEEAAEKETNKHLREAAERVKKVEEKIMKIDISSHIPKEAKDAVRTSKELGVPLHPEWTMLWHDIDIIQLGKLRNHVLETGFYHKEKGLLIKKDEDIKNILISLCCLHRENDDGYLIDKFAVPLLLCLGIQEDMRTCSVPKNFSRANNVMKAVNLLSNIKIMKRAPTRIGARMGRPEKADKRQMKPPVHGLYPVGMQGGPQRLLKKTYGSAVDSNTIPHLCPKCKTISPFRNCPDCGTENLVQSGSDGYGDRMELHTREDAERAAKILKFTSIDSLPEMKGVKGLISKEKIPERVEKGLLRAKHNVFVFRDGTIRSDMTDITLSHFRPFEISSPVEGLRKMGYTNDIYGKELKDDDQVLELKVQDIVVNEAVGDYLVKVANFVDDELELLYGMERYYNVKTKEDLIGVLAIGLAPHTSAGVLCRIIGFIKSLGCMGHPYFHAAKRRNCDGDEDAVMLLMEGLLNFSKKFLPERRGGQMDAPLVLSMRLDPMEVDKEAHNIDVRANYPLDFYLATTRSETVNEYWMNRMDTVRSRLGTPAQYEGFMFSNDTWDMNFSPRISAYKTIGVTEEKINAQLELARILRAVDEDDVAERVLTTHLLPDLIGNLRSFSKQSFRCTRCGAKYRRVTLTGKCTNWIYTPKPHRCNNNLILTVSEGSVKKYLAIAQRIASEYEVSNYLRQRLDLMSRSIETMFPERFKETKLEAFM